MPNPNSIAANDLARKVVIMKGPKKDALYAISYFSTKSAPIWATFSDEYGRPLRATITSITVGENRSHEFNIGGKIEYRPFDHSVEPKLSPYTGYYNAETCTGSFKIHYEPDEPET